jgi:hypothetical protein
MTVMVAAVALAIMTPAVAQTSAPNAAPAAMVWAFAPYGASPGTPSPPASVLPAKDEDVTGTVANVDPAAKTVQVTSGFLGLFGKTLQVTDHTQIQVEGRPDSLMGIREGAKIRASYEPRTGKNYAKVIEVMLAESTTP